ncbi:PepSY domain-containing protein [Sphaerisporangium perillae]|uniref:PepSY domain-containing protein n=1 Tax=Sphaerisporangium perillae TaxID=2935860 RepID=UPI00201029F6|nr:PepSY domain-containing protein [Sphaerisporangium perillae]
MTNTKRISKTARLTIAGAGIVAVLATGTVAASASAALQSTASTTSTTSTTSGLPLASTATTGSSATSATSITYGQAIRIAKKRVPGARVTEVEREWEHGVRVWKVELRKHGAEYRVYISVRTGKIVKFRQKHDD